MFKLKNKQDAITERFTYVYDFEAFLLVQQKYVSNRLGSKL